MRCKSIVAEFRVWYGSLKLSARQPMNATEYFNSQQFMYYRSPFMLRGKKPARRKSTIFFKVMLTLAVHVAVIGEMLLQGCKDTRETGPALPPLDGPVASAPAIETLPPVLTVPSVSPVSTTNPPSPVQKPLVAQTTPPVVVAPSTVTSKRPKSPGSAVIADATVYKVQPGDTLAKIARAHHTSYKKIMAMNDLKTTTVRLGQVLKLPALKPPGSETPETASN